MEDGEGNRCENRPKANVRPANHQRRFLRAVKPSLNLSSEQETFRYTDQDTVVAKTHSNWKRLIPIRGVLLEAKMSAGIDIMSRSLPNHVRVHLADWKMSS